MADPEARPSLGEPPAGWVYAPYTASRQVASTYWTERFEREAAKNWDLFYRRHSDRFFKDRHYLAAEWPVLDATAAGAGPCGDDDVDAVDSDAQRQQQDDDLSELQRAVSAMLGSGGRDGGGGGGGGGDGGGGVGGHGGSVGGSGGGSGGEAAAGADEMAEGRELVLLEAGCGVGNTLFPLLRANPLLRCFGVDFADSAIAIVQSHPLAQSGRVRAAVGDLTSGALPAELAPCLGRCDVATLMFVLSAISPERMGPAVDAAVSSLRDGGVLLVRDYANGDGAQRRLASGPRPKQLDGAGRFFARQDGTRAYYFEVDELRALVEARGFVTERCEVVERSTTNRAKGLTIERRYVVGTFRRDASRAARPAAEIAAPTMAAPTMAALAATEKLQVVQSAEGTMKAAPQGTRSGEASVRPSHPSAAPAAEGGGVVGGGVGGDREGAGGGASGGGRCVSDAKMAVLLALDTALGPTATALDRRRLLSELAREA